MAGPRDLELLFDIFLNTVADFKKGKTRCNIFIFTM
jgi:hypothetical protein